MEHNLNSIVRELHRINFKTIIKYDDSLNEDNVYSYGFEHNRNRIGHISDYCRLCDDEVLIRNENGFRLTNISHGSHTVDFLHALGFKDDSIQELYQEEGWKMNPVLFLMENPATDGGHYRFLCKDLNGKRPAMDWYWIHRDISGNKYNDDHYLVQQQYGNMVLSLISQFKLGNAYLTNTVKCGMTDARMENDGFKETGYKNLNDYPKGCRARCVKEILSKEIGALCKSDNSLELKPLRIFAFGNRTYRIINDYLRHCDLKLKYQLYVLPHPANRVKNAYRKHILKGILSEAFENMKYAETGSFSNSITKDDIRRVFQEAFSEKNVSVGSKRGNNRIALKISEDESLFFEDALITEVKVKGYKNKNISFEWGMGYVFESNEYWYWNYESKEYVNSECIPYHVCFIKAIEKLKKEAYFGTLQNNDPSFSPENQAYVMRSVQELREGRGTARELIEEDERE